MPESITFDLGDRYAVETLLYLPRVDGQNNGIITQYRVSVSQDGETFTEMASGNWPETVKTKTATLPSSPEARYVRLEALEAGGGFASAAEINVAYASGPFSEETPTRIESTFDDDTEDWGAIQNGGSDPEHVPTGGNPGGHITDSDSEGGIAWYYTAPIKFLGPREAFYGEALSFDLRQDRADNRFDGNPDVGGDVTLFGNNIELVYDYGGTEANPGTEWTEYWIPLSVEGNWMNTEAGQPPTEDEFRSVLAGLESLLIRGEYRSGADRSYLDNVVLSVASTVN